MSRVLSPSQVEALAGQLRKGLDGLYAWADATYGRHEGLSGEWECTYPGWHEIWPPAEQLIRHGQEGPLDDATVNLLLEAMARDNEVEQIMRFVAEHPGVARVMATAAVGHRDPDARWQAAVAVEMCPSIGPRESEHLLLPFRTDSDEYVRRRAMLALSSKAPAAAVAWAVEAWGSADEYQRMAALEVLHRAQDARFEGWASEALRGSMEYLRAFAAKLGGADGG